jgi:hypothetical protein
MGYLETKNLANSKDKKGLDSGKNCRKIVTIELDLDTHKNTNVPHLVLFRLFVHKLSSGKAETKYLANWKYKKGHNCGKTCQRIVYVLVCLPN